MELTHRGGWYGLDAADEPCEWLLDGVVVASSTYVKGATWGAWTLSLADGEHVPMGVADWSLEGHERFLRARFGLGEGRSRTKGGGR